MKTRLQNIFTRNNIKQILLDASYILFSLSLLRLFIKQLFATYTYDSWNISEFLVNYQGGFVRRGLTGEILFFIARNFNINVEWTIKIICFICLVMVSIFFIRAFLKKGYSLYILPLCFFLGSGIFSNDWIRKDYLFFCFFIPIIFLLYKNNLSLIMKFIVVNFLTTFIILSHEVFAFFSIPILYLLLCNQYKNKGIFKSITLSLAFLLPSIFAFLSTLYFHGNHEMINSIWNSWASFVSNEPLQFNKYVNDYGPSSNAVNALGWSLNDTVVYHIKLNFFAIQDGIISIWIWTITFPVVYYIVTNALMVFRKDKRVFTDRDKINLSTVLLFQLFCLSPIFLILSCDYIRIIFYWIASSFAIFLIIPKDNLAKLFPSVFIRFTERINLLLSNLLRPTKTSLVFLMMFIGISKYTWMINWAYGTTMLYNILWLISKPIILLKDFLLNIL
ncbi:hypothetical protein [Confluentibacter sediminis]|uniref:hypothetical protein n=1 Tax=Confluentibacter sediminis TaxID=2219045 RepID=UPI0013A6F1AE|nr:hypothetical protein [Confluentibacter sediminis]